MMHVVTFKNQPHRTTVIIRDTNVGRDICEFGLADPDWPDRLEAAFHMLGVKRCVICGSYRDVERELSRSQLLFGGFDVKYELRCKKCEAELCQKIDDIL